MYSTMRILLIALILLASACGGDAAPPREQAQAPVYLVAVNHPLQYFARRLGGDELDVRLPAPADTDPAQWQPGIEEMLELQGAELVLLNGAGYSGWLDKVAIADKRLVVTSAAARDQWLQQQGQVTHSHGPEGEHAHGGYLFTTWMDMRLARVQAQAVAAALLRRWPEREAQLNKNLDALLADIDALDAAYAQQTQRLAGRQFIYSHPVYQYFERRYGTAGDSLHWEPDSMPGEGQWGELAQLAGEDALFVWEAEPEPAIAARMAAMGIEFLVIDPAANRGTRDWLAVQRENLERLEAVR